jgi:hypothetical protein
MKITKSKRFQKKKKKLEIQYEKNVFGAILDIDSIFN